MIYNIHGFYIEIMVKNKNLSDFFYSRFKGFACDVSTNDICSYKMLEICDESLLQYCIDDFLDCGEDEYIKKDLYLNNTKFSVEKIYNSVIANNNNQCIFSIGLDDFRYLRAFATKLMFKIFERLSYEGIFCLHGAGVTINKDTNNGVFVFGPSGSGKSSIVMKLIEKYNEQIICDDIILIQKTNGNRVIGLSNPQNINMEKKNLKKNYKSFENCIVENLDPYNTKIKIDINNYSNNLFAKYICPNTIFISSSQRKKECEIIEMNPMDAYKYLINSTAYYINKEFIPIIYDLVNQCKIFKIIPALEIEKTVNAIYKRCNL